MEQLQVILECGYVWTAGFIRLIDAVHLVEGSLSQIEERALHELALGAGASKVVVWVGPELSDAEVKEKLDGK